MRAIFCGTPEIAVPALNALFEIAEIAGVVCQPDRPSGRGMKMQAPAVKLRAETLGLQVIQPEKVRDGKFSAWIRERNVDVVLVIAYGRILGIDVLTAPRLGCVNLHASLLPQYRGAAPIQHAIMNGETETGVCLMKMDVGMDTGDILSCHRLPLDPNETSGSLAAKLGEEAARVTRLDLPRYLEGLITPLPQDHSRASYAPPIEKTDTLLDLIQPAEVLARKVRGLAPRPGASAQLRRQERPSSRLKILEATAAGALLDRELKLSPGELHTEHGRLLVGTGDLPLEIHQAQLEGKRVQSAVELINGRSLRSGDLLF